MFRAICLISMGPLLSAGCLAGASVFSSEYGVEFKLKPGAPAYIAGQAIELVATFKHVSKEPVIIDFGAGFSENLEFSISKDGAAEAIKIEGVSPAGLSVPGAVKVGPGELKAHHILLDKHIELTEPGEYQIELKIGKELRAETKIVVFANEAEAKKAGINPPPDVKAECESLRKSAQERKSPEQAQRALEMLSYTRHEAAIPYLKQLILAEAPNGNSHYAQVARSLIHCAKPEAIETLVKAVFERMPKNSNYRRMTAYFLREYGTQKLPANSQKLLQAYKDEIESSIKLETTD